MLPYDDFGDAILRRYLLPDGQLKTLPSKCKRKLIILEHLVKGLDSTAKYTEQEINEYVKKHCDDFCTVRREFIINGFMRRSGEIYEVNPRDAWADWRTL